jgi:hypothetical protein
MNESDYDNIKEGELIIYLASAFPGNVMRFLRKENGLLRSSSIRGTYTVGSNCCELVSRIISEDKVVYPGGE